MSKYVVFKCTKCGKTAIHEVRKTQSKKSYYLSCKFCEKKSNYERAVVYKVFDLPSEATLLMNQINLGKIDLLPLDEAEKLVVLGVTFMEREGRKITPARRLEKVSVKDVLYECMEELENFSLDELEECMGEREILIDEFEKLFENACKKGEVIEVKPNVYRYIS